MRIPPPRWKDQHRAHPVSEGVPCRRGRGRPPGRQVSAQVARSFGISESCLTRWLRIADRDDATTSGSAPPPESDLEAENRELHKRAKQLEQENEILRRATAYFARVTLPK
jgi:transposase